MQALKYNYVKRIKLRILTLTSSIIQISLITTNNMFVLRPYAMSKPSTPSDFRRPAELMPVRFLN
jgi:hypothetical protein